MIELTAEDVLQYSQAGPRYTSYPSFPVWKSNFSVHHFEQALEGREPGGALSLYVHIPFCEKLCHFCACNRVIDPKHSLEDAYLEALKKEVQLLADRLNPPQKVLQFHWGGGTPTFLSADKIARVFEKFIQHFSMETGAEISMEVNPVVTTREHLQALARLGFNRISMGVQDFDPLVQDKINRHQSFEITKSLVEDARDLGFGSINLDLIYGLPRQNLKSFSETIEKVLQLKPERLAVYSFAKVPWKQPFQRRFKDDELLEGLDKIALYREARKLLISAGYAAIGMDHFALPQDELFEAQAKKKLHRNFMGYTTKGNLDLVGFGSSAISSVGNVYTQNVKTLPTYASELASGRLPIEVGHSLSLEDQIRRRVILELMCQMEVDFSKVKTEFQIDFHSHFGEELNQLRGFESEGMLKISDSSIRVIGRGQVLVRNMAMVFDQYLSKDVSQRRFSNTI